MQAAYRALAPFKSPSTRGGSKNGLAGLLSSRTAQMLII
jgi:hypothetical protein